MHFLPAIFFFFLNITDLKTELDYIRQKFKCAKIVSLFKPLSYFPSVDPDYSHVVSVAGTKCVTVPTRSNFSEKPKPLIRLQMLSFTESEKILKTAPRKRATYEK